MSAATPGDVKRLVYRVFLPGDLRKAQAESADSDSGGGARDLRLRPHAEFGDVFSRMFPGRQTRLQKRGGQQRSVEIYVGRFSWSSEGDMHSREAEYWPPTPARPNEGRVARIYSYPPLTATLPEDQERPVVLLVQDARPGVWPYLVTEKSLRSGEWDPAVSGPIVDCLDAHPQPRAPRGFVDFELGERRCFG